jgi:hypothetical protein
MKFISASATTQHYRHARDDPARLALLRPFPSFSFHQQGLLNPRLLCVPQKRHYEMHGYKLRAQLTYITRSAELRFGTRGFETLQRCQFGDRRSGSSNLLFWNGIEDQHLERFELEWDGLAGFRSDT